MFKALLLGAAVAVVTAVTVTITATPAETKRTPLVRVRIVQPMHMGKTAQQWQAIAQRRLEDRNWLQKRLGIRVRQLIAMSKRFKAEPTRPPHYYQWLCIHNGEGAWDANTGNGFYGGLQFMQGTWTRNGGLKYASRADLAAPVEQMWVAEQAWRESGGSFAQWPNTARACGLL